MQAFGYTALEDTKRTNDNNKSSRIADGARIINMAFANAPVALAA
jgi:hypothetical protein